MTSREYDRLAAKASLAADALYAADSDVEPAVALFALKELRARVDGLIETVVSDLSMREED